MLIPSQVPQQKGQDIYYVGQEGDWNCLLQPAVKPHAYFCHTTFWVFIVCSPGFGVLHLHTNKPNGFLHTKKSIQLTRIWGTPYQFLVQLSTAAVRQESLEGGEGNIFDRVAKNFECWIATNTPELNIEIMRLPFMHFHDSNLFSFKVVVSLAMQLLELQAEGVRSL